MAVTEQSRNRLQQRLEKTLGAEDATTLMEMLDDRATRQDVENVRQDVENLRQSTLVEFADVRTELRTGMADLRTELRTGIEELRTELRTGLADGKIGLADFRADLRAELRTGLAEGKIGLAGVRTEIADVRADFNKALLRNTLVLVGTNVTLFGLALFKL